MSLITRCPACGTMFKVVTDQLKVSRGWVRCGRCAHVFDAPLHLQPKDGAPTSTSALPLATEPEEADLALTGKTVEPDFSASVDEGISQSNKSGVELAYEPLQTREAADLPLDEVSKSVKVAESGIPPIFSAPRTAPRWIAGQPAIASPSAEALSTEEDESDCAADFDPAAWREAKQRRQQERNDFSPSVPQPLGVSRLTSLDTAGIVSPRQPDAPGSAAQGSQSPLVSEQDVDADSSPESDVLAQARSPSAGPHAFAGAEKTDEVLVRYEFDDSELSGPMPLKEVSFVRDAQRKAFWSRTSVRAGLMLASCVFAVLLLLQWGLQRRDDLAAMNPAITPLLRSVCAIAGCEVRPPRHIDAVIIDSSTFNRIGADAYRLTFVIKNTGNLPVEVPAVEVTLTDPQDQALIRRVVIPAQFGVSLSTLGARSDVNGALSMKVTAGASPQNASASITSVASLPVAGYRVVAFYP
jgi:predicted Zn finger-like uncharacterized protein